MLILYAMPADIPVIAEIRTRTFTHFAPQSYSEIEVETLLNDLDEKHLHEMVEDKRMFVMKDNQIIVGTSGWDNNAIRHVYVEPSLTRQGIGKRLLEYAEYDYRQRTGNSEIFAGITLYSKDFYEANFYTFLSKEKDWDGSWYYKMKKTFASE